MSLRENLDLCRKYALAGLTSSYNGAWAYVDIDVGDFVSFLYGAKVYDLYQVETKEAIDGDTADKPWPIIRFRSGLEYHFPFRLHLRKLRSFETSLVVKEFSYVGENLLLRGGYTKTHFQADDTTLHNASEIPIADSSQEKFAFGEHKSFDLRFTRDKSLLDKPKVLQFRELMLQSLIRKYLGVGEHMAEFLGYFGIEGNIMTYEALGEKALTKGYVDVLVKERAPRGTSTKVIIETKLNKANQNDIVQVSEYLRELGPECRGAALIVLSIDDTLRTEASNNGIRCFTYEVPDIKSRALKWSELLSGFNIMPSVRIQTQLPMAQPDLDGNS